MSQYQTKHVGTRIALEQKPNGDCVYLGDRKCEIWERRPILCRTFDCRRQYLSMTRRQRQDMIDHGLFSTDIFAAARRRINTISQKERNYARSRRRSDEGFGYLVEHVLGRISDVVQDVK
jgi:Fe-S-cluster containining protein